MKDYIKELFEKMFGKQKRYIVGPATLTVFEDSKITYEDTNYQIGKSMDDDPEWNKKVG